MTTTRENDLRCAIDTEMKKFVGHLMEPCHTSAYESAKTLDVLIQELYSKPSTSDYGHAGIFPAILVEAFEEVKWNGMTFPEVVKQRMKKADL